jgi:hypothetical protein
LSAMPANDYDPHSEYKSQRLAAARKVELWIHKDERVLGIFQKRIQFAAERYQESVRLCERQEKQEDEDWKAALRDPNRRDKEASPPTPDYEWVDHDRSYSSPPTEEGFQQMQEEGFVGTWGEVQHAWNEKHWGYWRRRRPAADCGPTPWLYPQRDEHELPFAMPSESAERMCAYYCVLAAIYDKDLEIGPAITGDIWPLHLLHYVHLAFWDYRGDKTQVIQVAIDVVEQDLRENGLLSDEGGTTQSGSAAEGEWSKPMSKTRMMQAIGIDSRKTFAVWLKDKDIHKVGDNRQTWIIRLDTLDQRSRKKLEKA